jgi:hypothetical protein
VSTVLITRRKLAPVAGFYSRGPAWRWTYTYSVDGEAAVEYGPGLASLRRLCREKWPTAEVVCDWEQAPHPTVG